MNKLKYKKVIHFIISLLLIYIASKICSYFEIERYINNYISTDIMLGGILLIFLVGFIYTFKQLRK